MSQTPIPGDLAEQVARHARQRCGYCLSQQKYLYIADGTNDKVWILDRDSGMTLGGFGRNGTYADQLHWINAIAMDSKGNIYTGEVEENKRIQKFVPVMANN